MNTKLLLIVAQRYYDSLKQQSDTASVDAYVAFERARAEFRPILEAIKEEVNDY